MDIGSFITSLDLWIVFLVILVIGVASTELGVWLGQRTMRKNVKANEGLGISLVGSMLALLAFMLGFTFSITSSRLSSRREVVVDEARAISTCYLRTGLITEKQKNETRRLFREYIDVLVDTKKTSDLDEVLSKVETLNLQIWDQAASLSQENMDSELRSLYIKSVNDVLEIFQKRKTVALVYRIPSAIWTSLLLLFILSMFIVGYEISDYKRRRVLNIPVMATAFALIVSLIADMDSTVHSKKFKVNQKPLIDVQKMIHERGS